jgi:hypothetical protein
VLAEVLRPQEFQDIEATQQEAIGHVNERLKWDGYEVHLDANGVPKVRSTKASEVGFQHPAPAVPSESVHFRDEQIAKCDQKLRDGDFDGAITNARSLIEAILMAVDADADAASNYDGDLPKLYKRVQRDLDLEPSRPDLDTALKQVLTGLSSVVIGLAGVSNKMGDRHARAYRPEKRHAVLVVDAAKTLSNFLVSTHSDRAQTSR